MKRICVIDGQGGGIGSTIIKKLRDAFEETIEIVALGTNAIATAQMLKAGANRGASGQNAIVRTVTNMDVIVGPIGIVMAHAMLGIPFVIITVTATLVGFDHSMTRAAASLGASPITTFRKISLPLILPGVISGALFAFATSFDEVVVVLSVASYDQRTIPLQMWNGIREQISPTILSVATILVIFSITLLTVIELLRRRSERLRGITPG